MQLLHSAAAVRSATAAGDSVLVPTMGGLHEGHLALVRHARTLGGRVVVSIYVNPLQFGVNEDFGTYPRRLREDCTRLEGLADIVYAPSDEEMYAEPQTVGISLPPLAEMFCGKSRPGFFQGVAVVVCKLFNQCRPTRAVFGRKDYQQALVVQMMCRQLNMDVDVVLHPTVREHDGLAMSSRNEYLTAGERERAPLLYSTLLESARRLRNGGDDCNSDEICNRAKQALSEAEFNCDYFAIRAAADLGEPQTGEARVLLAAAWLGKTRLIDNVTLSPNGAIDGVVDGAANNTTKGAPL